MSKTVRTVIAKPVYGGGFTVLSKNSQSPSTELGVVSVTVLSVVIKERTLFDRITQIMIVFILRSSFRLEELRRCTSMKVSQQ